MAKKKGRVFAIFGLGQFGRTLAEVLTSRGGQVIAADSDSEIIDEMKDSVATALLLDATNEHALAKAPLEDVDVAIITFEDIEASIITTVLLKKFGIPYIISRGISAIHTQVLKQIGANEVVNLQESVGRNIAMRLIMPDIHETVALTRDTGLTEVYIPTEFYGKRLEDLQLDKKFNLHIVGIKRIETTLDTEGNPEHFERLLFLGTEDVLKENDIILVIGKNGELESFKSAIQ